MIYFYLFIEFFKIGLFTFGGAYAMIPLVKEVVIKHGWLTESHFYDFIGVCESTPGPIAVNMATYVGQTQGGLLGSIISTFAVVLPSFIIILLIASVLNKITDNKYFKNILKGIKPVIVGLILSTGIVLTIKCFGLNNISNFTFSNDIMISIIVFIIVALIYYISKFKKKKISSVLLILISAILGLIISTISNM